MKLNTLQPRTVWGYAEFCHIPGVEQEILVSPGKAKLIPAELPNLVRDTPFWMDVSVHQSEGPERRDRNNAGPAIFRNAFRTLAVRDGDGLYRILCHIGESGGCFGDHPREIA